MVRSGFQNLGGDRIEAILMAHEVRGRFCQTLTGAWRHMDGQMRKFSAELCSEIEKLHGDMFYVLIGGQR